MCSVCQLTADDIQLIADSKHVDSLQLLRLDYNDLNVAIEPLLLMLSRLAAIQTLRLQACRVKYRNCLRCAETLAHSRTLRTWNFLDNVMYKVSDTRLDLFVFKITPIVDLFGFQISSTFHLPMAFTIGLCAALPHFVVIT